MFLPAEYRVISADNARVIHSKLRLFAYKVTYLMDFKSNK